MEHEEGTSVEKRRNLSNIAMHKQSKTLTKSKPKIRIIHVYAPEIIKTDVSSFRELVQKLTGKPDHHHRHDQKGLKRNPNSRESHDHHQVHDMNKCLGLCVNSQVDEEERQEMKSLMTWNGTNSGGESSSGEFLNGLGDFDGYLHDELYEFPYLPLTIDPCVASSSSHLHDGLLAQPQQFV
ncbi:unnamed protein product [Cochlearia groenlandica]